MTRRLPYIDWARGLAVLLMIHGHVLDAWTRDADRSTRAFGYLTIMGGFAAPLFLWLAGLSLILAAEQRRATGASRLATTEAIVKRGLEVSAALADGGRVCGVLGGDVCCCRASGPGSGGPAHIRTNWAYAQ